MIGAASATMPASPLLNGVLPVLQTPLQADGSIDVPTLEREIDCAFQVGADGVVIAMVSEILRLGYHGRKALAAHV
jgi:2-keto-3-deoxy-L-arabinonate dehydratase